MADRQLQPAGMVPYPYGFERQGSAKQGVVGHLLLKVSRCLQSCAWPILVQFNWATLFLPGLPFLPPSSVISHSHCS